MFANFLLEKEKESFIKLLIYIAQSDGFLSDDEEKFIKRIACEVGSKPFEKIETYSKKEIRQIAESFTSSISKRVVLLEIVNLAYTDNLYLKKEKAAIEFVCDGLGIPTDKLEEVERWVHDGVVWAEEGLAIIKGDG
jgi:hypothetical protein